MTDPDATPPMGPSVEEQARSERALVRPGVHVAEPAATDADWVRQLAVAAEIDRTIQAARAVLRIARKPWQDATWPHVVERLKAAALELSFCPEDDIVSAYKLDIVRKLIRGQRA